MRDGSYRKVVEQDPARNWLKIMIRSPKNNCKSSGSNVRVQIKAHFRSFKPFSRGINKKLKQIERSWNAWDIFTGLDPRLLHVPKWRPCQRNRGRHFQKENINLKWYCDQKIISFFSFDFESVFAKHPTGKILSFVFYPKAVYFECKFWISQSAITHAQN